MTLCSSCIITLLLLGLPLFTSAASSGSLSSDKTSHVHLQKTLWTADYRPFLINDVFNYYGNNGDGSYNRYSTSNEGFEFVKGSNNTTIFEEGVIWGGFQKGFTGLDPYGNKIQLPRVGGSIYRHGLQPGPIVAYGEDSTKPVAADPSSPANRV